MVATSKDPADLPEGDEIEVVATDDVGISEAQRAEIARRDEAYANGAMKTYSEQEVFEALELRARG